MKMLSMKAREVVDEIAAEAGMTPGDTLNALLEAVVPDLARGELLDKLIAAIPRWMTLQPGEATSVVLGLGEEAAFRAKLMRFKNSSGQRLITCKTGRGTIAVTRSTQDGV